MPAGRQFRGAGGDGVPRIASAHLDAVDLEERAVVVRGLERPRAGLVVLDLEPALELAGLPENVRFPRVRVGRLAVLVHHREGVNALDVRPVLPRGPCIDIVGIAEAPHRYVRAGTHLELRAVAEVLAVRELDVVGRRRGGNLAHVEAEPLAVAPAVGRRTARLSAIVKSERELVPSGGERVRAAPDLRPRSSLKQLFPVNIEGNAVVVVARERPDARLVRRHVELAAPDGCGLGANGTCGELLVGESEEVRRSVGVAPSIAGNVIKHCEVINADGVCVVRLAVLRHLRVDAGRERESARERGGRAQVVRARVLDGELAEHRALHPVDVPVALEVGGALQRHVARAGKTGIPVHEAAAEVKRHLSAHGVVSEEDRKPVVASPGSDIHDVAVLEVELRDARKAHAQNPACSNLEAAALHHEPVATVRRTRAVAVVERVGRVWHRRPPAAAIGHQALGLQHAALAQVHLGARRVHRGVQRSDGAVELARDVERLRLRAGRSRMPVSNANVAAAPDRDLRPRIDDDASARRACAAVAGRQELGGNIGPLLELERTGAPAVEAHAQTTYRTGHLHRHAEFVVVRGAVHVSRAGVRLVDVHRSREIDDLPRDAREDVAGVPVEVEVVRVEHRSDGAFKKKPRVASRHVRGNRPRRHAVIHVKRAGGNGNRERTLLHRAGKAHLASRDFVGSAGDVALDNVGAGGGSHRSRVLDAALVVQRVSAAQLRRRARCDGERTLDVARAIVCVNLRRARIDVHHGARGGDALMVTENRAVRQVDAARNVVLAVRLLDLQQPAEQIDSTDVRKDVVEYDEV